jgi:hypothetical protein
VLLQVAKKARFESCAAYASLVTGLTAGLLVLTSTACLFEVHSTPAIKPMLSWQKSWNLLQYTMLQQYVAGIGTDQC